MNLKKLIEEEVKKQLGLIEESRDINLFLRNSSREGYEKINYKQVLWILTNIPRKVSGIYYGEQKSGEPVEYTNTELREILTQPVSSEFQYYFKDGKEKSLVAIDLVSTDHGDMLDITWN